MHKLTLFSISLIASIGLKDTNNLIINQEVKYNELEYMNKFDENIIKINDDFTSNNYDLSNILVEYNKKD